MRRALVGCALGLSLFAGAPSAHANGRFPTATQLVVSPTDPQTLVVRATFGLLVSHDAGKSWGWICETAVGYTGTQDPMLGAMHGAIIAGTLGGLARSTDEGCSWGFALPGSIVDVVVRKNDPSRALALVNHAAAGDASFAATVMSTVDDGATWTAQGAALDPSLLVETIEVAASDAQRLYISAIREVTNADGGIVPAGVLLASSDNGATYTEAPIALQEGESAPFLAAVDPLNANRVYVRIKGKVRSRLVVSDDGGATFRTVIQAQGDLLGFALAPDGSRVYAGGPDDGLMVASSADLQFTQVAPQPIQCLATSGKTLYACMGSPHAYALQVFGVSNDEGATLAPTYQFTCVQGPLACPAASATAKCASEIDALHASFGPSQCVQDASDAGGDARGDDADASAPVHGEDAGSAEDSGAPSVTPTTPQASGRGCGCGVRRGGEEGIAVAIGGLAWGWAMRRRRRSA